MLIVNGQAPQLTGEAAVRQLQRLLGEPAAALRVSQIYDPATALSRLERERGQTVVLIPPDDAEAALHLAAEVYQRTGTFPVIARLPARGDTDDHSST